MSVDPGDGWRLLKANEEILSGDHYYWNGKWFPAKRSIGSLASDVNYDFWKRRIVAVNEHCTSVSTSGPYIAIEAHRAALAEIERLKAELDAVKQPKPEPEPEWFDLTPFGEHVLRRDVDWVVYTDSERWQIAGISRGAKIGQVRGYIARARCLLKDAPPELVAMASKPEWPKYYTTDDLSGSRIAYIIRCSQSQYQMMTTNGTVSENVFFWGKFDDETRTEISKEKADAILEEKRLKAADSPEKPKPKTEREVLLYWYDGNVVGRYADCPPTDQSFIPLIVRDGKVFVEIETREVGR